MKNPTSKKYYNWNKAHSYNALFHFIISERSLGKTYGFLIHRIKQTIYKNKKMIVLTKFKTELEEGYAQSIYETIVDDILMNEEVKDFEGIDLNVELKGNHIFINDKVFASFYSITQAQSMRKITELKTYDAIWHDEFMTIGQYAPKEVDKLLMIWDTMDRNRNIIKVYLTANPMTRYNPYFEELEIPNNIQGYWYDSEKRAMVHISKNIEYQKERLQSALTKLAREDSDYIRMASKGEFSYDEDEYVMELTTKELTNHKFGILVGGKRYVLSTFDGGFYIHDMVRSNKCYHNKKPSTKSIKMPSKTLKAVKQLYYSGIIYFANIDIKNNFIKDYVKE